MVNENLEKNSQEANQFGETYFSYYFKQRNLWITVLLSFYGLLNIIALFISTNFTFDLLFNYFGFLMIILSVCIIYFVTLEKKYLYGLITSIILGVIPVIEISCYSFSNEISGKAQYYFIFSLIIAILFIIFPFLTLYIFKRLKREKIKDD